MGASNRPHAPLARPVPGSNGLSLTNEYANPTADATASILVRSFAPTGARRTSSAGGRRPSSCALSRTASRPRRLDHSTLSPASTGPDRTGGSTRSSKAAAGVAPATDAASTTAITLARRAMRRQRDRCARVARSSGYSSAIPARNSSVVCENPLSFTSPISVNSRCDPAASTTGRVTSTSPPAARATTRALRFTSRP